MVYKSPISKGLGAGRRFYGVNTAWFKIKPCYSRDSCWQTRFTGYFCTNKKLPRFKRYFHLKLTISSTLTLEENGAVKDRKYFQRITQRIVHTVPYSTFKTCFEQNTLNQNSKNNFFYQFCYEIIPNIGKKKHLANGST